MKLTKEECEYRLSQLKRVKHHIADEVSIAGKIELDNGIKNYEALLNEHFGNPSLSIEWFKNESNFNTWIWDDKFKFWVYFIKYSEQAYMQIRGKIYTRTGVKIEENSNCYYLGDKPMPEELKFEDGRFYLKEVKEATPLKQSNNELNAETMFKKLGFILDSKEPLTYRKDDGGYITEYMFNPLIKRVQISEWEEYNNNLPQGSTSLHIDHIEAINQQMIELGWI